MSDGFINDWLYASWTVKVYYYFLLIISLWTVVRAIGLARMLSEMARSSSANAGLRYRAALASARLGVMRELAGLTLIVTLWSVAADLIPALHGEPASTFGGDVIWLRVIARMTERLSFGCAVAAFVTIVAIVFENILRRRMAALDVPKV